MAVRVPPMPTSTPNAAPAKEIPALEAEHDDSGTEPRNPSVGHYSVAESLRRFIGYCQTRGLHLG